ncbi:MAG: S1C family serine protease [Thermodesulfobacteriota bacterium]|nr:S1C family serine protease [Thermodesulfobacteriota bacterium]
MKRVYLSFILAIYLLVNVPAYAEPVKEEVLKAVVKIRSIVPKDAPTARTLGTERQGNGVVIDGQGHILTIGYLIIETEKIEVIGPEGKTINAAFIGFDHNTGFGLIKAEQPFNVAPMKLGQSLGVKEGDQILVAGYGGAAAVQGAWVIARKEFAGYWEYLLEEAIFTAPAIPDFGGAALINREGKLLGIGSLFTQIIIPGLGAIPCNVFVPIDLLSPILEDLMTKGRSREAPRPWLGLNAEEAHGRVFVVRVTTGAPAEKAGLQPGDIILKVGGKAVDGLSDFYRKVWALGTTGVEVPLSILQGTQIRDITVRSSDRYQFLWLKSKKLI